METQIKPSIKKVTIDKSGVGGTYRLAIRRRLAQRPRGQHGRHAHLVTWPDRRPYPNVAVKRATIKKPFEFTFDWKSPNSHDRSLMATQSCAWSVQISFNLFSARCRALRLKLKKLPDLLVLVWKNGEKERARNQVMCIIMTLSDVWVYRLLGFVLNLRISGG